MHLIDNIFSSLSDRHRLQIVSMLLHKGDLSVGDIAEEFPTLTRQAVSKHIENLVHNGIVTKHKRGRMVYCMLSQRPFQEMDSWLHQYDAFWDLQLKKLKRHLDEG